MAIFYSSRLNNQLVGLHLYYKALANQLTISQLYVVSRVWHYYYFSTVIVEICDGLFSMLLILVEGVNKQTIIVKN